MNKNIVLQRTIEVQCWRVIGQVAKAEKRLELIPVLQRASDMGVTDADDIAQHLLFEPGSRRIVAARMLQMAQACRLLEDRRGKFGLTDDGVMAIQTGRIFVPEAGAWTVWASNDPLLSGAVLRVDPWDEPNAFDEVRGKDKDDSKKRPFQTLPQWVRNTIGAVTVPAAANGVAIRIDELQPKGESVVPKASLQLEWDVAAGMLQLVGQLQGRDVRTALQVPDVALPYIWQQMLEGEQLWPQWDESCDALRAGFADINATEREAMRSDLVFDQPNIAGFGSFDKTTVPRIALRAASAQDAQAWAEWRLQQRIRDYASDARFAKWKQEAAQPFAGEFSPRLPSRPTMARDAWKKRGERPAPGVWHIVAAEDWSMV
jgi:hypothetical protein